MGWGDVTTVLFVKSIARVVSMSAECALSFVSTAYFINSEFCCRVQSSRKVWAGIRRRCLRLV